MWTALLETSLAARDFERVGRALTQIEVFSEATWKDLRTAPRYREFFASDAGRAWLAEREAAGIAFAPGDDDFIAFARDVEAAAAARDVERLEEFIPLQYMFAQAAQRLAVGEPLRHGVLRHLGRVDNDTLARNIVDWLGEDGHYTFLRLVETEDGFTAARFRSVGLAGLNYHDLILCFEESGRIFAGDLYNFVTAEHHIDTTVRLMEFALEALQADDDETAPVTARFAAAMDVGDDQAMIELYPQLPEQLRNDIGLAMMYVLALDRTGDDAEVARQKELLAPRFEGTPSFDLWQVDVLVEDEDWPGVLAATDRIDEAVGGDPYLEVIRAGVFMMSDEADLAIAALNRAIEREPTLPNPYWVLLEIALAEENHEETARLLTGLVEHVGIELPGILESELYLPFIESGAFDEWLARHEVLIDLSPADLEWLESQNALGIEIVWSLVDRVEPRNITISNLDRAWRAWQTVGGDNSWTEDQVVTALAVLFARLVEKERLAEQAAVYDPVYGTTYSLYREDTGAVLYPFATVGEFLSQVSDEPFRAAFDAVREYFADE